MRLAAAAALAFATLLAAPAVARAGDGTDLLGLVPDTADVIVSVDVADARDSALFAELLDRAMETEPSARQVLADAGIALDKDVDTILCAMNHDQDLDVCVIEGRLPKNFVKHIADADGGAVRKFKGVPYAYTGGGYAVAVVKKRLLVTRVLLIEDVITLATSKKGKNRGSVALSPDAGALRAMIADTDTRHDAWAATSREIGAGFVTKGMSFAATAGTDLALQVRARFADEDGAVQLEKLLREAMAQVEAQVATFGLRQTFDSISFGHSGSLFEASLTVPEAELSTLMMLLKLI